jgi:ABC-type sugar transport system ATPase subunit
VTISLLELTNFSVASKQGSDEKLNFLFKPGCRLVLPETGIYTLEGDNQAGKSTLIKIIMGVIPCPNGSGPVLRLQGKPITINCVADAKKAGLGAVFQDDPLIPSLTVGEQFGLFNATDNLRMVLSYVGVLQKREQSFTAKRVLARAEALLEGYGSSYPAVLSKYPAQLSGGALSVTKIVKAQLQRPLSVLFMDEAFTGVQRDIWPLIVEKLKEWTAEHKITILAVTHSDDEIARWQPKQRLVIRNQEICPV